MTTDQDTPLELTIEKLITGGRGLARHDGRAVFVPGTAAGDTVRARIVRDARRFLEAELIEVVTPGPGRRDAPCPHYDRCGGCDLQHVTEEVQRSVRRDILLDCFHRLGGLEIGDLLEDAADTTTAPALGYRNRLRLTAHPTGLYGLQEKGTHDVVPLETCPVMGEPFDAAILPWLRMLPPVDQIVVRLDGRGGWLLSLYGPVNRMRALRKQFADVGNEPPVPGLQGVLLNNRPVWGRGYLVLHVADQTYRVSHQSFFQGNLAAAELAVATARRWLDEVHPAGSDLADLFCGVGLFLLALADRHERLLGIEADASAVADARENLRRTTIVPDRYHVHEGEVARALTRPEAREAIDWPGACVVVDPPRAGLGKQVVASLTDFAPPTILYLSCDPATLARDCKALAAGGYNVARIQPLPMFPQTSHLETLVLLRR
jgi:23S rRNA (uracil1939-C5)-methyltransferase